MDSRNKREATETYQIHKGEVHNLMKHCIQKPPRMAYSDAQELIRKRYEDRLLILSAYRNLEIGPC